MILRTPIPYFRNSYCYNRHFIPVAKISNPISDIAPEECKMDQTGADYMGDLSWTRSGLDCLSWFGVGWLFLPDMNGDMFPDGSITAAGSRCRNPRKFRDKGPWCGTSVDGDWEYCDVPKCE